MRTPKPSPAPSCPGTLREEFDAFLNCSILAHGFLRLRRGECSHDKLLAYSFKRQGLRPELVNPVLKVVQRVVKRHLLDRAGLEADEGRGGAVTLIQHFGSATNLNIQFHCLALFRRCAAVASS